MEHQHYECISALLVDIHVRAGTQSFHDRRNGPQKLQMKLTQRESCVDQQDPRWILRRNDMRHIDPIQPCRLEWNSRLVAGRIKVFARKPVSVETANSGRGAPWNR